MRRSDQLLAQLDTFKANQAAVYILRPIEKWMEKELNVKRIITGKGKGKKKGKGSIVTYYHPLYRGYSSKGHFTIHILHKSREQITKINFAAFLYRPLKLIIEEIKRTEAGSE